MTDKAEWGWAHRIILTTAIIGVLVVVVVIDFLVHRAVHVVSAWIDKQ